MKPDSHALSLRLLNLSAQIHAGITITASMA
jgi:hypothetical protein